MPNSDPQVKIFNKDSKVNVNLKKSDSQQLVLFGSSDYRKSKK